MTQVLKVFLNKDLQVDLRGGKEIVITKREKKPKTSAGDPAGRSTPRQEKSSSSRKPEPRSPVQGGKAGRVFPKSGEKKATDEEEEEYIKTKEYDAGDEEGKTSPLRESARERSSSHKGRRHSGPGDKAVYRDHPRRSAFKK